MKAAQTKIWTVLQEISSHCVINGTEQISDRRNKYKKHPAEKRFCRVAIDLTDQPSFNA